MQLERHEIDEILRFIRGEQNTNRELLIKVVEIHCHVHQILKQQEQIMSAISDFAAAMAAFQARVDTAISDLQGDVKNLNDQITALQNSTGGITPADQALLDGIQAKASAVADQLDALDALTPPVTPSA